MKAYTDIEQSKKLAEFLPPESEDYHYIAQGEKSLLLRDLCARLPYHVRCKIWLKDGTTEEGSLDLEHNYADVLRDAFYYNDIKDIKPFLRPMSSMTEEEKLMYEGLMIGTDNVSYMLDVIDWLNAYHFDYRGLISKGLALETLEGMYNV